MLIARTAGDGWKLSSTLRANCASKAMLHDEQCASRGS
jgi:hypothetical protein